MKKIKVVRLLDTAGKKVWGIVEDGMPHNGVYYRTKADASVAKKELEDCPEYPGHCDDCGTPQNLDTDQNGEYQWFCPVCK